MPQEALPIPHDPMLALLVPLRREYRDALGRPMSGTVTLTASEIASDGPAHVAPVPVPVTLAGGVLSVQVAPGTYLLEADLWSVDDAHTTLVDTVALPGRG